jgi:hypothetical protein
MANETVFSNFTTVAAYVASGLSPFFRTNVVGLNLVAAQNFREKSGSTPGSMALKFGKMGQVTVSVTSEASAVTKSQYQETSVSITAQKASAYVELSLEAELFGNQNADLDQLAADAGLAAAQKFDVDLFALANGFSGTVGTTNVTLTANELKNAPYKLRLNKIPGPYVTVLHPTQVKDLQGDIITTGAAVWANPATNLDVLGGQAPQANGRVGSVYGVDIYESTNILSINTATDWEGLCFSPRFAFAVGVLGRFIVDFDKNIQSGLTLMALHMFYQQAEWNDGAGIGVISKQ